MEKEFIRLINLYPAILYKVCNIYCKEEEAKKDLFQEIVLQLWKAFPSFRNESSASTWIYRIALNTAISNYRKEHRKPIVSSLSKLAFQISEPDDASYLQEQINQLYQAVGHLSTIEKALIMLYLDDKSYNEIAIILGITKSNVGVKLNRIKAKLEKLLNSPYKLS